MHCSGYAPAGSAEFMVKVIAPSAKRRPRRRDPYCDAIISVYQGYSATALCSFHCHLKYELVAQARYTIAKLRFLNPVSRLFGPHDEGNPGLTGD